MNIKTILMILTIIILGLTKSFPSTNNESDSLILIIDLESEERYKNNLKRFILRQESYRGISVIGNMDNLFEIAGSVKIIKRIGLFWCAYNKIARKKNVDSYLRCDSHVSFMNSNELIELSSRYGRFFMSEYKFSRINYIKECKECLDIVFRSDITNSERHIVSEYIDGLDRQYSDTENVFCC